MVFRHSHESTPYQLSIAETLFSLPTYHEDYSQNKIVLTCYRNAVRNANTTIGHNIAFLRNTLGIDIDNNEITLDISLPKVYHINEQRVLQSI